MIKNLDTLMTYSFSKNQSEGELYVTINNDKNKDNSLHAYAYDQDFNLITQAASSDRNKVGYVLQDKLEELGYKMTEFRISKKSSVLVDLLVHQKGRQQ